MPCYNSCMNQIDDNFRTIFDDQHDDLMEYLKTSSSEQKKTFNIALWTLIVTAFSGFIALAALIIGIIGLVTR